ncbi:MAG TPA: M14 family metallopeptidase [Gemmatimonadales bacterium]|nr:M14 family metallopeptidase [Gemmatimonadales bacterium]
MSLQPGSWFRQAGRACVEGVLVGLLAGTPLVAQVTRPERSNFQETSSYSDVLSLLDSLQRVAPDIRVGTLAVSPEGRRVPYVLASHPVVSGPADAHRSGKLIVYLQANIHAGEVEGKEAAQMLLRDLTMGPLRPMLDQVVLLIVPIYNTDGNEHIAAGEENRPGQNGPAKVGRNPNGQGLNLNRDYVKMEAPETQGAAALLSAWDPDLFIDLHTTNGSYHGYVLTYAPGLNPNSNPAADFTRDRLLPAVRERMQRRHRQRTFSYGNFRNQDPDSLVQGWETYDARPRFGTNWMGLRGRLAVLSEGYSNADFQTRIVATYNFVREVLALAVEQRAVIRSLTQASDRRRPDSVSVRSVLGPPTVQEVIAEITEPAGDGAGGFARRKRTGVYRAVRMPVFDRFVAARREAIPAAYLIPPQLHEIVELLRRQGIVVESLAKPWRAAANDFLIDSIAVQPLFEGHRPVQVEGRWRTEPFDTALVAGWYLLRTDQPLGVLASYLLEPASDDGVVTWNFLDRELQPGARYPILRVRDSPRVPATAVP